MREELKIDLLDKEKLSFILDQVEQNQRFHLECSDALRDQGNKVLASIFVSSSALIGFGSSGTEDKLALAVGALGMGLHLLAAGAYLVWRGMRADDVQAMGNEPDSLVRNEVLEYPTSAIIAGELRAKQEEITTQKRKNENRGMVLNRSIKGAMLSPITFVLLFGLTSVVAEVSPQSASLVQAVSAVVSMVLA